MERDTVLLVDDEPGSLLILRAALRNEPFEVLTAASGEAAMAIIQRQAIDAVVTDQDMPGMSGTELLALLRRDYPTTARFMLTGCATLGMALDAINLGAIHRFFVKPCNLREVAVALRQALRRKQLVEESRRLLAALRRPSATLENLEAQYPGISGQNRDPLGAFVIDELIEDVDDILKRMDVNVGVG